LKIKEILQNSPLPQAEIQILLSHVLEKDRSFLFANPDQNLAPEIINRLNKLLSRRAKNEPIQYILKSAKFYGLDFYVDKRVLIPRPETEELVSEAIKHFLQKPSRDHGKGFNPFPDTYRIIDVGTGSGNIAISLAKSLPKEVEIVAIDISPSALEVASYNARVHGVGERINLIQGNLLHPLRKNGSKASANLIVSNLPYISEHFYLALEADIKDHEPKLALVGGPTGLELYHRLFLEAKDVLKPGGKIIYELDGRIKSHTPRFT